MENQVILDEPSPFTKAVLAMRPGDFIDVKVRNAKLEGSKIMARIAKWQKIGKVSNSIHFSRKKIAHDIIRLFAF